MVEVCTAPILKAVGPQVSPLSPGQALAKIMQPPGKEAKLGKSSHVLTTSRSTFPAVCGSTPGGHTRVVPGVCNSPSSSYLSNQLQPELYRMM